MTAIHQDQSGFTLLELLIALTIFAIGLLAIAGLQVSAIRYNSGSNLRTASVGIAQGIMEQIMAIDADDLRLRTTVANIVWDLDTGSAATTVTLPGSGTYSATWSVTADDPVNRVSRISVTVQAPQNRTATLISFRRYNL